MHVIKYYKLTSVFLYRTINLFNVNFIKFLWNENAFVFAANRKFCFVLLWKKFFFCFIPTSFPFWSVNPVMMHTMLFKLVQFGITTKKKNALPNHDPLPLPRYAAEIPYHLPRIHGLAPGSSSSPATPSSSGKVKSRSRSKSPFRSFRWRTAKKLIAGSHHSDDEGIKRGCRVSRMEIKFV